MCVRASHSLVPVNNFNGILFLFSLSLSFFFQQSSRTLLYFISEKMLRSPIVAARWRRRLYIIERARSANFPSCYMLFPLFLKNLIFDRSRAHRFFFLVLFTMSHEQSIFVFSLSQVQTIICTAAVRYSLGGKKVLNDVSALFF